MKSLFPYRLTFALAAAVFLALVSAGKAAVIVNFNSNAYTTTNFASMTGWTSGTSSVAYSDSTYRNPANGANYDTSVASAKFYGGASTSAAAGLTTYRVANQSGTWTVDNIAIATTSQAVSSIAGIVIWKQADFLALSSGYVTFDSSTAISLSLLAGVSGRSAEARLIIQQSGNYYISSVLGTAGGTVLSNISVSNPTTLSWFNYDPSSLTTIGSSATLANLGNLTEVGIYASGSSTGATTGALSFGAITINAVPEPGVSGLGALACIGGAALMVRRRAAAL